MGTPDILFFLINLSGSVPKGIASSLRTASTFGAVVMSASSILPQESHGALLTGSDAGHQAIAANYEGSVGWIRTHFTTTTGVTSSFTASGVFLNGSTFLTNAHNVATASPLIASIDSVTVGNGLNFNSSPGQTRNVPYRNILVYPGYDPSNSANTIDLAIIHILEPIANTPTLIRGSAAPGETVISVGYGMWGWSASSLNTPDGNARGWEARVDGFPLFANPDQFYNYTSFGYNNLGLSYNGRLANGDSGSPVFNQDGELVGINKGFISSASIYVDTQQPDISAWIGANTAIPGPPKITATVVPPVINLTFAHLIPSREYRIMRSPTLSGWEEAHRFTAAAATGLWGEALASGGRMFYRLEWNE